MGYEVWGMGYEVWGMGYGVRVSGNCGVQGMLWAYEGQITSAIQVRLYVLSQSCISSPSTPTLQTPTPSALVLKPKDDAFVRAQRKDAFHGLIEASGTRARGDHRLRAVRERPGARLTGKV